MSNFRLGFANVNVTVSETNSLGNLRYKDSGNLWSQYSCPLGHVHEGIFEYSPTRSNVVKMVSHLVSLEHCATKLRLCLI